MTRRFAALLAAAVASGGVALPTGAQAVTYRYWTYWTAGAGGSWTYASTGPASVVPADGAVEGWRFAVTEGVRGQGQSPRIAAAAAFRQFCGDEKAAAGQKRVAVVFDFGETGDAPPDQTPPAPRGTCVVTAASATGALVLSQAATVRSERGLVCAIADYPQGECAPAIAAEPTRTPDPAPSERAQRTAGRSGSGGDEPEPEPVPAPAPAGDQSDPGPAAPAPGASAQKQAGGTADDPPGADPATPRPAQERPAATAAPAPAPTVTSTQEPAVAAAPVFTEAQAVTETVQRPWWPAAVTVALVAGIGGVIWWRRRTHR